jgi:hypothetical protein
MEIGEIDTNLPRQLYCDHHGVTAFFLKGTTWECLRCEEAHDAMPKKSFPSVRDLVVTATGVMIIIGINATIIAWMIFLIQVLRK